MGAAPTDDLAAWQSWAWCRSYICLDGPGQIFGVGPEVGQEGAGVALRLVETAEPVAGHLELDVEQSVRGPALVPRSVPLTDVERRPPLHVRPWRVRSRTRNRPWSPPRRTVVRDEPRHLSIDRLPSKALNKQGEFSDQGLDRRMEEAEH
jgi:hypothetical protein